jgi:nucleoid-associated protein YgaU
MARKDKVPIPSPLESMHDSMVLVTNPSSDKNRIGAYWVGDNNSHAKRNRTQSHSNRATTPKPTPAGNPQQKKADKEVKEVEYNLEGSVSVAFPNPHLRARKGINLWGLGTNYSGLYRVETVVNTINCRSGYDQNVEVKRNAFIAKSPQPKQGSSSRDDKNKVSNPGKNQEYIVKSGDNLWTIAKKFYGKGSEYPRIAKVNGITNPSSLKPGQKLIIPAR